METVFQRDEKGVVTTPNGSFVVPSNLSVLSMFNGTPIYDGDDFTADPHWIINSKGIPRRKQLRNIGGQERNEVLVWTRKLDPDYFSIVERRFFELQQELNPKIEKMWKDAIEAVIRVGRKAHAIPRNSEKNGGDIWLYDVRYSEHYECETFGFQWVERPKKFRFLDEGQALYDTTKRCEELRTRLNKYRCLFQHHVENMVRAQMKTLKPYQRREVRFYQLTVNGREYPVWVHYDKYHTYFDVVDLVKINA